MVWGAAAGGGGAGGRVGRWGCRQQAVGRGGRGWVGGGRVGALGQRWMRRQGWGASGRRWGAGAGGTGACEPGCGSPRPDLFDTAPGSALTSATTNSKVSY